jgi:DNA-binding MarR family transcriptional regulator
MKKLFKNPINGDSIKVKNSYFDILNPHELYVIVYLSKYNNNNYIDPVKIIMDLLEVKRNRAYKILKSLNDKNVISITNDCIFLN